MPSKLDRPEKISVCVITYNERRNLERCLESARWADEIVVLDSFSTDDTVEIARRYTDRVSQHKWMGYIGQKKLIKDLATCPWVMFVDADEEVSDELRKEILDLFSKPIPKDVDAFEFPRLVRYLDRWIRHGDWYPDIKLRLFRKDRGQCGGQEPHDRIFVPGRVCRLKGVLHHYTYTGIEDQVATLNRFSSISANGREKSCSFGLVLRMLFHPPFRFFRSYFLKRGFLDGVPGLVVAKTIAFGTFIKYAKIWERQHLPQTTDDAGR
ncbi:MAG: glycosyltransferase family 2 protein [Kiritimatiellia bacterium]|jgi:glycosyltransferase involved in cell wall biosynthesis